MAIIKYGPLASEVSGTVGGVTFARVRAAKACRVWRAPVNKRTTQQLLMRTYFAKASAEWFEERSAADRTDWDTYAATCTFQNPLGENYTINGFNMYVRTRGFRIYGGWGGGTIAPVGTGFPATLNQTFSFTHATALVKIETRAPVPHAASRHFYFFYPFTRVTRNHHVGPTLLYLSYLGNIVPPAIITSYPTTPPGLAGDYKAWILFRYHDEDNRLSKPTWYPIVST